MISLKKSTIHVILFWIIASLLMMILNYYVVLSHTINAYFIEKKQSQSLLQTLKSKKTLQISDVLTQKSLLLFKSEAYLYDAATTMQTPNQLSEQLALHIKQSGFSIHSIQPLTINNRFYFQVNAEGDYFALFRLFDALEKEAWPIYVAGVVIEKKNQFHLNFSTQGLS